MNNWKSQLFATLFFGYALLVALDLPGIPARMWLNQFLDMTFGAFHISL